jgi:hypothetical protein
MGVDAELLLDEESGAWAGPQLGGETVFGRVLCQPTPHDLLLCGRQFGRSPRCGSRRQTGDTLTPKGGHPAANTAGIDVEKVGSLLGGIALADALDGETPTVL